MPLIACRVSIQFLLRLKPVKMFYVLGFVFYVSHPDGCVELSTE